MKRVPYTRRQMDAARAAMEPVGGRFDGLHAEAKAALASTANGLRAIREEYRAAYIEEQAAWLALRRQIDARDGALADASAPADSPPPAAPGREAREELQSIRTDLGSHQAELNRLEMAIRNLESIWLFLERGDTSLIAQPASGHAADVNMRIVQAQEAERSRLAREVHDGPAQAFSNAIFQVEHIEKLIGDDVRLARTELHFLRELLRRELNDLRGFISQLRPPLIDALGLNGALKDTIGHLSSLSGVLMESDLQGPIERLDNASQTVVLRVVQEGLQNVRKHASASKVTVTTRAEGGDWILEIQDDGRGFDVASVASRGRRNFGIQFMQERAELIGARFDVRSQPNEGTVVRLAIPMGAEETR
jgi:two-component system, NarL family, sensor histidine kinase DegS